MDFIFPEMKKARQENLQARFLPKQKTADKKIQLNI